MKTQISLLVFFFCSFFKLHLSAQIVGGFKNGQSTPKEVKASEITSGGMAGDVNLFTGTYNTSYTLGTVSNISGLSYTLQLSNSSTFSSGDNLPHTSGIPYGDGWNVDIPTLSVSVEDYNKYSIWEAARIGNQNSNFLDSTKQYYEIDSIGQGINHGTQEGQLSWFAPMLNIPGVASGRLVYKYEAQGKYVFVLHQFERYVEAHFDGSRWEIVLDDGTRYDMGIATLSHRNSSNQRVQEPCYQASSNGDVLTNGGALPNLVLPKSEFLSWYCIRIFNRTQVGSIRFFYNSFGKFNFFKVYNQPRFLKIIKDEWKRGILAQNPMREVARDILLTEVRSDTERLILDYESIPVTGGYKILDFREQGVYRKDSLYSYETIYHRGGDSGNSDNWKRYLHIKAQATQGNFPNPQTSTNPYKGTYVGGAVKYRFDLTSENEMTFQHGYLESPRIGGDGSMPAGDIYEIQTKIHQDNNLTGSGGALFDINLASGDHTNLELEPQFLEYNEQEYEKSRGQAIFSTFPQAVKWHSRAVVQYPFGMNQLPDLETSNYFVMPNLPSAYDGFNIQVGPANSDNNFAIDLHYLSGPGIDPYICQSYYQYSNSGNSGYLNSGDDIPQNFGVGLPWHIMKNFYSKLEIHDDYCNTSGGNAAPNFWWTQSYDNNYENKPTRLRSETNSPGIYKETKLKEVKVIRYGKNPYMLKRVRKVVHNTGGALLPDIEDNTWHLTGFLEMDYDITTTPLYASYYDTNAQIGNDAPSSEVVGSRNIIRLRKIIQLPTEVDISTINKDLQPTTHFDYWDYSDLHSFVGLGYAATVWPNSLNNIDQTASFNSSYSIIDKITDPLGKETNIVYYKFSEAGNRSYSLPNFRYKLRPNEKEVSLIGKIRSTPPYSFQSYMVVKTIKVKDEDGDKIWTYNYYTPQIIEHHTPLGENFTYDDTYSYKFGYQRVDVRTPVQDGMRNRFKHYFHTTEQDGLLWGKMYKQDKFGLNNVLLERQSISYEALLAFENPTHRKRKFYSRYDYQDYRIENPCPDRPLVADFPDYRAYLDALYGWMGCEAASVNSPFENWVNSQPQEPDVLGCPLDLRPCTCENYEVLNSQDRQKCIDWFEAHYAWVNSKPYIRTDPFFVPNPDGIATWGIHDAPVFYETRHAQYIEEEDPVYLNSYFIKKTKEINTVYEDQCSDPTTKNTVSTTTEYEYFDANYAGYSDSPGYTAFITDPGFDPTGITDNGGLAWEPSWQLYSKKNYTDKYANANDAYTLEENFYLFDLANDPSYQIDPDPYNPYDYNPHLKSNLTMLWQVHTLNKIRNLPYESRITTKAPGQSAVVKSTHYEYKNDWDADDSSYSITRIPNPAGVGDEWPCQSGLDTSDDDPVGGSGFDPGVIYNSDSLACIYYHSSTPPPTGNYNCPMEGYYFWYCQCENNLGGNLSGEEVDISLKNKHKEIRFNSGNLVNTSPYTLPNPYYNGNNEPYQIQDPYDDPYDSYVNNTLIGKIMLEKVQQQVSAGNYEVSTFHPLTFAPQYPHEVQLLSKVTSRNRYGQVTEEVDDQGLVTRYGFSVANAVEYEDCYQDSIQSMVLLYLNENPGLPSSVTVGYGLADALTTAYEYDLKKRVSKVTDPNGTELTYEYDDFGRMKKAFRNGVLLQETEYKQWQNNFALNFTSRTYQNYVHTTSHVDIGQTFSEKIYIDPLGRKRGTVRDDLLVVDNPIFNNSGQQILQLKPSLGSLPVLTFTGNPADHTEMEYENHFRSRLLKSSKNGLSINGSHLVSNAYCTASNTELASDLTAAGLSVATPSGSYFFKTTTTDEDNKSVTEYSNAIGQKVATITLGGTAATVFYYDSQGNVKEVINPEGQSTTYQYNYLGQLYQKNTTDGGTTIYAYNSRGQLIAEKDAQGEIRLYQYDLYGRMIHQAMTLDGNTTLFDNNGMQWVNDRDLTAFNALMSAAISEKRWYYNTFNPADYNLTPTEVRLYLDNSLTNTSGKLVQTVSYDRDGTPLQFKFMAYTDDGFLKWEIEQFNYNGISASYPGMATRIDYPRYNLGGGVKTQNIDLNCDQILDMQYYYTYDHWNRLKEVYAQFDNSKDGGHKVASYEYDDVKGVVTHRRHYASKDNTCKNIEVDDVEYTYEAARFRLTDIASTLFDWHLYYDDNVGAGSNTFPKNYNGNINVSVGDYHLDNASNNPGTFTSPTIYNYRYDELNRLTEANADIEEYYPDPLTARGFGDTKYTYDKIGNLLSLNRTGFDLTGNTEANKYLYTYGSGNNRLLYTRKSTNNGAYNTNRSFSYDSRGNLLTDTYIGIINTEYGRANLPWKITKNYAQSNPNVHYKYDINDARIYKASTTTPTGGVATISEYYLRSASGQELGIYDYNADELQWYIYGTDRVAKMKHLPTAGGSGGSLGLRSPQAQQLHLSENEQLPTVLEAIRYGYDGQIDWLNPANQEKLALVERLKNPQGEYQLPNNLYYIRDKSDDSQHLWLQEDWVNFDTSRYELLQQAPILSERQRLVWEDEKGREVVLSLGEMGLAGLAPDPDPTPGPQDPFVEDLPDMVNPPIPVLSYYVYDHLGNTRIVYNVGFRGICENNNTGIIYNLENVQDYYPYGKTLRKFTAAQGQERFLTTQHERDEETGLDYRGARFYDGDVGRFLSLDPLAEIYPSNSDYFYVAGNPISIIDPDGREWSEANKELADLYGVFGQAGETFNNVQHLFSQEDKGITISKLWNNYPSRDVKHVDPDTKKDIFPNHCAINCSEALQNSGIKLNNFKGTKCWHCPDGTSNHAIRAEELADWMNQNASTIEGISPPKFLTGDTYEEYVQGKKGIIFFQDYWQRNSDSGQNRTGDHIDLWWDNTLKSNGQINTWFRRTFPTFSENWLDMSDLRKSKKVIFWEIN